MKLWSPYMCATSPHCMPLIHHTQFPIHSLSECGHTFCYSCLQDWFGKTLDQHIRAHPQYNVNVADLGAFNPLLQNYPEGLRAQFQAQLRTMYQPPGPHPEYTCPSCRAVVKSRPVPEYTLKAAVRAIASATGEGSPKKTGGAVGTRDASWDKFFGKSAVIGNAWQQ
jgi:hypothetical protein